MKSMPPPPMAIFATGEEKFEGLSAFIAEALELNTDEAIDVLLVARSASSPVARAVAAHGHMLARRQVRVKAVFGELSAERTRDGWALAGPSMPFTSDVRHLAARQYHDVHEQLIVGRQHAWFGDSLKRDPDKRDALSLFNRTAASTVEIAGRSFEMIWGLSNALEVETAASMRAVHGVVDVGLPECGSV
ncbi:MAG: hypothetical protein RL291_1903, partial [Pseudomonadota bacterium]